MNNDGVFISPLTTLGELFHLKLSLSPGIDHQKLPLHPPTAGNCTADCGTQDPASRISD